MSLSDCMEIVRNSLVENTVLDELVCGFDNPGLAISLGDFLAYAGGIHLKGLNEKQIDNGNHTWQYRKEKLTISSTAFKDLSGTLTLYALLSNPQTGRLSTLYSPPFSIFPSSKCPP